VVARNAGEIADLSQQSDRFAAAASLGASTPDHFVSEHGSVGPIP
jgi:hypothetical protein